MVQLSNGTTIRRAELRPLVVQNPVIVSVYPRFDLIMIIE